MPKKRTGRTPSTSRQSGGSPTRKSASSPTRQSGGAGGTVLAFVLGAGAAAGAGYLYLHSTPHTAPTPAPATSPVPAAARSPERPAAPPPLKARVAPFGTSEDVFEAGAHLYAARCASCHGSLRKDAAGQPSSQQLWREARRTVAAHSPSDLYNSISTGNPGKGMPAYAHTLTDTQLWQLALLLKNADGDLPDPVVTILNSSH